jgi:glutamine amidotransferase
MKVAVIDYGMGNLGSVTRAFVQLGAEVVLAEKPAEVFDADRLVLPGVGNFSIAMERLSDAGWIDVIKRQVVEFRRPLLGICLGMQLLATFGDEGGGVDGLALIPGKITLLDALGCRLRVPHVGWNDTSLSPESPLFKGIPSVTDFFYVHSYAFDLQSQKYVIGTVDYGIPVVAAVQKDHIFGTQFHPEKSSKAGIQVLKNFLTLDIC